MEASGQSGAEEWRVRWREVREVNERAMVGHEMKQGLRRRDERGGCGVV
jgi:hypothetical protein